VKKVVLMVSFLFLFSAVGFASPLTDFSQGKASIDINWRPSSNLKYPEGKLDGNNNNFDFGLTIGLGDKFGFQWQNQTAKSKNYSGTITVGGNVLTGSANTKLTANQFNILYSLDKSVVAFVGYTQAKNEIDLRGTYNGNPFSGTIAGKTVNGWQAGFAGSFPLGDKFFGYGSVGFGNKITSFEIGITYEFSKNAELNLFYKSTEYKDLQFKGEPDKYDLKVDGPGIGLTFKF